MIDWYPKPVQAFTSTYGANSGGGVLWISSDGGDRRIFLGLKFLIS